MRFAPRSHIIPAVQPTRFKQPKTRPIGPAIRRPATAAALLCAMITLIVVGTAGAQTEPSTDVRPLEPRRWTERKYGISLNPPIDTTVVIQPGEPVFARILDDDRAFEIRLSVKQVKRKATVEELLEAVRLQIVDENTTSVLLEELPGTYADLPGFVGFYRVPMTGVDDVLVGYSILQADPQHHVVIEFRGKYPLYARQRPMLIAMLNTLKVADQKALLEARKQAITRTLNWRKQTPPVRMMTALAGERYYRIVEASRDVGWMKVTQRHGEFNAADGVKVTAKTHMQSPAGRLDAVADYFRPDEAAAPGEAWSVRATVRNIPGQPPDTSRTAVETGTVTLGLIKVVFDGNSGVPAKRVELTRPSTAYLPQAEAWVMHRLLPREQPATYGFYFFNNNARNITFRTDRVTPTLDGFTVHTRLSPNEPELMHRYDALGELVERELGGGRSMIRTSEAQLKAIWRMR